MCRKKKALVGALAAGLAISLPSFVSAAVEKGGYAARAKTSDGRSAGYLGFRVSGGRRIFKRWALKCPDSHGDQGRKLEWTYTDGGHAKLPKLPRSGRFRSDFIGFSQEHFDEPEPTGADPPTSVYTPRYRISGRIFNGKARGRFRITVKRNGKVDGSESCAGRWRARKQKVDEDGGGKGK
jgi:hypothetical protein